MRPSFTIAAWSWWQSIDPSAVVPSRACMHTNRTASAVEPDRACLGAYLIASGHEPGSVWARTRSRPQNFLIYFLAGCPTTSYLTYVVRHSAHHIFNQGETMKTTHETIADINRQEGQLHATMTGTLRQAQVSKALEILAKKQTRWELPKFGEKLSNGATLYAIKAYSFHPGDHYLFTVMAKFGDEYVTWMYNADHNGCGGGSYHNKRDDHRHGTPAIIRAEDDYAQRHRKLSFNTETQTYSHG